MSWTAPLGNKGSRLLPRPNILLLALGIVGAACGSPGDLSQSPVSAQEPTSSTPDTSASTEVAAPATTTTSGSRATPTTRKPTGGAVGAPFDVPVIVGLDKEGVRQAAKNALESTCGPDRCGVTLVDVDPKRDPTRAHCKITFTGTTDPKAGTRVSRGSVIKLIFEYESGCDPLETTTSKGATTTVARSTSTTRL